MDTSFEKEVAKDFVFTEIRKNIGQMNIRLYDDDNRGIVLSLAGNITQEDLVSAIADNRLFEYDIKTLEIGAADKNTTIRGNALSVLKTNDINVETLITHSEIKYRDCESLTQSVFKDLDSLKHIKICGSFPPAIETETKTIGAFEDMESLKTCVFLPNEDTGLINKTFNISEKAFKNSSLKVFFNNSFNNITVEPEAFTQVGKEAFKGKLSNDEICDVAKANRQKISQLNDEEFNELSKNINYSVIEKTFKEIERQAIDDRKRYGESLLSEKDKEANLRMIDEGYNFIEGQKNGLKRFCEDPKSIINNQKGVLNFICDTPFIAQDYSFTGNELNFYQPGGVKRCLNNLNESCYKMLKEISDNLTKFSNSDYSLSDEEKGFYESLKKIVYNGGKISPEDYNKELSRNVENPANFIAFSKLADLYDRYQNKTSTMLSMMFDTKLDDSSPFLNSFKTLAKNVIGIRNSFGIKNPADEKTLLQLYKASPVILTSKNGYFGERAMDNTNLKSMYIGYSEVPKRNELGLFNFMNVEKLKNKYEKDDVNAYNNLVNFQSSNVLKESPVLDKFAFANNQGLFNAFEDCTGKTYSNSTSNKDIDPSLVKSCTEYEAKGKKIKLNKLAAFAFHPIREGRDRSPIFYWGAVNYLDQTKDFFSDYAGSYKRMTIPESLFWLVAGSFTGTYKLAHATASKISEVYNHFELSKLKKDFDDLNNEILKNDKELNEVLKNDKIINCYIQDNINLVAEVNQQNQFYAEEIEKIKFEKNPEDPQNEYSSVYKALHDEEIALNFALEKTRLALEEETSNKQEVNQDKNDKIDKLENRIKELEKSLKEHELKKACAVENYQWQLKSCKENQDKIRQIREKIEKNNETLIKIAQQRRELDKASANNAEVKTKLENTQKSNEKKQHKLLSKLRTTEEILLDIDQKKENRTLRTASRHLADGESRTYEKKSITDAYENKKTRITYPKFIPTLNRSKERER